MHVVVASHHRLPVEGYGGPQRVVVALVRGLAALGHRVTILAQPGTKVREATKIVEVAPRLLKDSGIDLNRFIPDGADILHAHYPMKKGPKDFPFVQTLHGNWKPGTPLPPHTIFLSRDTPNDTAARSSCTTGSILPSTSSAAAKSSGTCSWETAQRPRLPVGRRRREAHGAAADHRGRLAPDVYRRHQVRRRSRWEEKSVLLAAPAASGCRRSGTSRSGCRRSRRCFSGTPVLAHGAARCPKS